MHRQFSWAILFVVLCTLCSRCYSFDIAIYHDPLSVANDRYLYDHRRWYSGTYEDYIADSFPNLAQQMDSVYNWYREMGVTKVMVNYPFLSNYDWILGDTTGIKLMNVFIPADSGMTGDMYSNAQYRDVFVGNLWPNENGYWSYADAIRDPADRTPYQPSEFADERPCVAMGPGINNGNGSADTLWRPTSYLGKFSGWDWYFRGWRDSSIYMPMHFRLTWAVDPNDTVQITTNTPLADFYWIVKIPDNRLADFPNYARWWRFPVRTLKLNGQNGLADSTNWIVSNFYEDAQSGEYMLLDAHFDTLSPVSWEEIYFGPAHRPRSLDESVPYDSVSYSGSEVRMSVRHRGTHRFYLNRIEVYDEGAYRMFALSN